MVDALGRDLTDVGAEEPACEIGGALIIQPMVVPDAPALDVLENEHLLGRVRVHDLGHEQVRVVGERAADELGVVRLLREVQLGPKVHVHLLGERRELEDLRAVRPALEEVGRGAEELEGRQVPARGHPDGGP